MQETTSHYEQERRAKVEKLRALNVDPFGGRVDGLQPLADLKAIYKPEMGHDGGPVVKAAGRIMLKRDMGKLSFLTLQDESGQLQVALDKKRLTRELDWEVRGLLDLGDQIVVTGPLGVTNKGETTVWANELSMASKALLPPPAKWEGLSDVELRYRQRYVDLWANPEVMKLAKLRIQVIAEIRSYLQGLGYLEVETPMMQPLAGGAAARPFETHHNALDIPLYMRIAPELYLKRLLVGGFSKVFELNRNFRNEGISPRHNPEFTMLEAYEAYGSWETMADMVEGMICHVAEKIFGGLQIDHANGRRINLQRPWSRVSISKLVHDRTGWLFSKESIVHSPPHILDRILDQLASRAAGLFDQIFAPNTAESLTDLLNAMSPERREAWSHARRREAQHLYSLEPAEQLQYVYEKLIEPTLVDPCFVTHVPSVIIPLAKANNDDPFFADVYELAINGVEISPGYTELNDPDEQAKHFAHQVGDKDEQQKTDDDFLNALRHGMPPAGGMGMGIDRLLMMLTGAESIRDVILFPLMKPQS